MHATLIIRRLATRLPAMKKLTTLLAALIVVLCCGCSTKAMKGTPFYTGEYAKREGPASDRVNLWPLAYYRDPALSILWPIGEFSDDRFAIRPLFSMYRYGKDEPWYEYNSLFGLISVDTRHHRHMFFPLYYRDEEDDTFLSLLYAQGRDWYAIPPLLSWWDDDNGSGSILLGLGGWDKSQAWAFPFFYRDKASKTLVTPLWASQTGHWYAIPPLLSWWNDDGSGRVLFGLGGWDESRTWALPLFYRDAASETLVTPLWATQAEHWSAIPPLLSWWNRNPISGESSLYLLGGLAGFEPDTGWIVPLYYRDKEADKLLSLPYSHGRDWSAIPPLLSWWKNDGSGRVLLGLGGWESDESWFFPLWYHDSDEFLTLLWGRSSWGRDHFTYWLTPLFGTRSGSRTGSWLFPLWDIEHFDDGSWSNTFLLLCGTRGGPREDNRTSFWFWPIFSNGTDPKLAQLRAEMDAPRAPDRQFYREQGILDELLSGEDGTTDLTSVFDRASGESTFLLGIGGSEHHVTLNPSIRGIARNFGETSAKGPLARFTDPSTFWGQPPAESSTHPTNAVARYLSEDSSWFFPLWSHKRKRGVMFDLPSGEKSLDAEIETFRALLFLYDWRHESVPEENHDYARRRVLWRLYHYERLDGDESTDIFPAITYDRRKEGYCKFSFLWRFFRYERDPEKGSSLDILFIPLRRPDPVPENGAK